MSSPGASKKALVACIIPSTYTDCIRANRCCCCKMHNTGSCACYMVIGNIQTVALLKNFTADKPQLKPCKNVLCKPDPRSVTACVWRLRNDSRGIFFMQWPNAQMRHFLCSCFIDRPGSLCAFFHRVCTLCRRICAHCHSMSTVRSVTDSGVLLKCGCGIMSR